MKKIILPLLLILLAFTGYQLMVAHKTVENLKANVNSKNHRIHKLNNIIKNKEEEINDKNKTIKSLNESLKNTKDKLEKTENELKKYDKLRKLNVVATGYEPKCDTGCTGITATGYDVTDKISYRGYRVVAVDKNIIPMYSIIYVETDTDSFVGIALDTGRAIVGRRIDVLFKDAKTAKKFGKQTAKVIVLREGEGK